MCGAMAFSSAILLFAVTCIRDEEQFFLRKQKKIDDLKKKEEESKGLFIWFLSLVLVFILTCYFLYEFFFFSSDLNRIEPKNILMLFLTESSLFLNTVITIEDCNSFQNKF